MKAFRLFALILIVSFIPGILSAQERGGSCTATYSYTATGAFVEFNATPVDSTWEYIWDFGDGQIGTMPQAFNFYAASGDYIVCLTVNDTLNNCTSSYCDTISVTVPVCNSTFTYTTDSLGTYVFYADPVGGSLQHFWDFGDGGFDQGDTVSYTYLGPGLFNICLYTNDTLNGCNSSICDTINVVAPVNCTATFISFPVNQTGTFVVQGMNPGMVYTFDFGDGQSGAPNAFGFANHTYAAGGTYAVCLNVNDPASGCTSSFCDSITIVSCMISADFTVNNLPNGEVFLQANTNGLYQYDWVFMPAPDDTLITTFAQDTLRYTFTTNGLKSVCLRVSDFLNPSCADSLCKIVNISGIGIEEYNALNNSTSLYPNPSSDKVTMSFTLDKSNAVSMMITDLSGKIVFKEEAQNMSAGQNTVTLNVTSLASGTYIMQLNAGEMRVMRRFTKN